MQQYYLVSATYGTQSKNTLQKKAQEYLMAQNRTLVPAEQLKNFKGEILATIKQLNSEYPRCTPIKASFWQPNVGEKQPNDYHLSDCHFVQFNLMQCKPLNQ